ncbi:MAG: hypothetical protein RLZZ241_985 [Bacteroidota bacterium]|jgi:PAS domain S-box-containing protein
MKQPDRINQIATATALPASQGVVITDMQGHILLLNRGAEDLSGYLSSELIGISVKTLISQDRKLLQTNGDPSSHFQQLKTKSGATIPVGMRKSRFLAETEVQILLLHDLRMEHLEDAQNNAHQTKIDALLEAIPDSIFIQDLNGLILDYFPPVQGQFLDSEMTICGKNMQEIFPEALVGIYSKSIASIRVNRKPVQFHFSWANPNLNHYEVRLVPMNEHKILSIVREVTESVQNKLELEKERLQLQHYLDAAASLFVVIDSNYHVVLANKKTQEVLAYSPQKIIGANWFTTFIPASEQARQIELFDRIIKGGKRPADYFENQITTPKGVRLIRWRNALLRDKTGTITSIICSGVDITESKRTEEKLFESESKNRAILDAIPDQITIYNSPKSISEIRAQGSLQSANNNLFNHAPELNTALSDCTAKDFLSLIQRVAKTGVSELFEYSLSTSLGKKHFETRFVPLDQHRVMGVARDISQSKQVYQILELRNKALEEASDAIVISDALLPDKPVVYCNKAFTRITGYQASEVLGKNCRFLQGNDQEQEAIGRIQMALQKSKPAREIIRNYRKDGSLFWNELSLTPIINKAGQVTHYIGVIREISDKIAEEKRQQGIRKLLELITADKPISKIGKQVCELLVSLTGAGAAQILTLNSEKSALVALADFGLSSNLKRELQRIELNSEPSCPCSAVTRTHKPVIVENFEIEDQWASQVQPLKNQGFLACWSYPIRDSQKEILGTCTLYEHRTGGPDLKTQDIIHEIIQLWGVAIERHRSQLKLMESNSRLEAYTEILEQNVEERTFEVKATLEQLLQTNRNLEAQIKSTQDAEYLAITNQKLFAAIAQNFPKGFIMVVDHNLQFLHLEGEELGSLDLQNWLYHKKSISKFPGLKSDQKKVLNQCVQDTLAGAHQSFELIYSGHAYTVNSTPLAIDNQPKWALLVWSNTTDRKRHEQELVRALEAQQELNDLKSRFMSMASHEFRTPLSAILSSATLIGKQNEPGKEQKRERYVTQIQNNVRNLVLILDDFLSLSKLDEGEITCNPTAFDFRDLLRQVLEELENNLKVGQHFMEYCEPGYYKIYQDPKLIRHILLNLLSNAIKYSPEHAPIELKLDIKANNLILDVRDYGIGIPKKEKKQIFNRFFRAKNSENIQGTGLGLNIVKQYTRLIGGTITFKSIEGEGSTFTLSLPTEFNTAKS